ncbi:MAG: dipeptidyl-peptidase 3 family protein [Syntrophothermus sp.]
MKNVIIFFTALLLAGMILSGCNRQSGKTAAMSSQDSLINAKIQDFAVVTLTTDLTRLSEKEKQMIPLLIKAAEIMDDLYWEQVLPSKTAFLDSIHDTLIRRFAEINYGPWERLNNNEPFVKGYGPKPAGANFYPADMTKEEFESWKEKDKTSQYSIVRRNDDKSLKLIYFHEASKDRLEIAADLLNQAAGLAEDAGLKKYLELRAKALVSDNYFDSDMAWMDMKTNKIDFVVGPIENYEDELFGYRTAFEAALLVKDLDWSKKLEKFTGVLPQLQQQLPVDAKYKKEIPASGSDLNAYDIIYVAGHSNAGGKTIAINLPNDEKVQLAKGSRRLQLKNAMRAKFDNILVPISGVLTDSSQRQNIKFDAFFANVMFHEVAHGLGIKNTINGKGTVRDALKEKYSSFEEAKADILGLFMVSKLIESGELKDMTKEDCFVTFMAGIIRSVRFGAADSHGKANMMCFNFFEDQGAFERSQEGKYKVNMDKMNAAMNAWANKVLVFEGDGDYQGAAAYLEANGKIRETLQTDIQKLKSARIPVDIIYNQGLSVLGL